MGSLPNGSEDLGSLLWNRGVPEGTEGRWEGFGAAGVSGGGGFGGGGFWVVSKGRFEVPMGALGVNSQRIEGFGICAMGQGVPDGTWGP